ncbi:MAG: Fe-S cluster assembly protein SufD [Thiomicrorhabdus sp.]|nr:MAG: Fe-S cluster assembly protein SufD [Thiomicrorhabdus sp.]
MSKKITRKISPVAQKAVAHYIEQSNVLNNRFDRSDVVAGRLRAQAIFAEQAFPTQRDEDWQYTKLTDFVQNHFKVLNKTMVEHSDLHAYHPSFAVTRIVFVDGWFDEELSDDLSELSRGVTIESLRDVYDIKDGADHLFARESAINKEPFGVLNSMLLADGYYLQVDDHVALEQPIFILNVQTQQNHISNIRNHVVLGENAELTLVEKYVSLNTTEDFKACTNVLSEITVAKSASFKQIVIQQQGAGTYYFNNQFVYQAEQSHFNSFYAGLGSVLSRHQNHLSMDGEHIESNQSSACLGREKQVVDSRTDTLHSQVGGISQQLHKYVLDNSAVGVFNGMIYVDRQAQKTDGQMDNKNLLLSERAKMNSKPQLEIYADDVKCSHGSATGQINKDQIFYLQARGIPRAQAMEMITQAFLMEPAEMITNNQIQQWVMDILAKQLNAKKGLKDVEKVTE